MLWTLLRKDFLRRYRSPVATIVMLVFPFVMALMIGMVSGGGGGGSELPETKLLLLDREDGFLGNMISSGGTGGEDGFPLVVTEVGEEGFAMMEKGKASALLVIPENFTDDLLEGLPVQLELVRNPQEAIKPEILQQGTEVIATYLDVVVKALGPELRRLESMLEGDEIPPVLVVTSFVGEFYEEMLKAEHYLFPPVVKITSEKESDTEEGEAAEPMNIFGYILVMVAAMSVLFVAVRSVTDLYEDAKGGMLRRQFSTPVSVSSVVWAKLIFAVIFGLVNMAILLVAGAILGWFQSSVPILWVLVHSMAFSLAAAGLMTLVVSLVKTEKQAGILSWVVVMFMSALGGSMFPAEMLPESVRTFSKFTLNYWAIEGYLDMIVRGNGFVGVMPITAGLAAVGVLFSAIGLPMLRRRLVEVAR